MQFNIRHILEQGAEQTGGLFTLIFRGGALLTAFGLPAVSLAHPPETEADVTAFYLIWGGMTLLLVTLFILIKKNTGVTNAWGAVYTVENDRLKIDYYKSNGKFKEQKVFALDELEFVDGGLTKTSSTNYTSGVRVKGSIEAIRFALKKISDNNLFTTLQLLKNDRRTTSELQNIAEKINTEIARARGISAGDVETARRNFLENYES